MRYFLLSLAAFLLLAVPAFAANDSAYVIVTVDISAIGNFAIDITEMTPDIDIIDWAGYSAGPWDLGKMKYDVETNSPWYLKMYVNYAYSTWLASWKIQESADNGVDVGWADMAETATTYDYGDNEVFNDEDWYFQLVGIAEGNGPGNYATVIYFTLGN